MDGKLMEMAGVKNFASQYLHVFVLIRKATH